MKDALSELLPRQARLWLYVITGTILLVLGTYEATEGNWLTFAVTLAGALQSNLAIVNQPSIWCFIAGAGGSTRGAFQWLTFCRSSFHK